MVTDHGTDKATYFVKFSDQSSYVLLCPGPARRFSPSPRPVDFHPCPGFSSSPTPPCWKLLRPAHPCILQGVFLNVTHLKIPVKNTLYQGETGDRFPQKPNQFHTVPPSILLPLQITLQNALALLPSTLNKCKCDTKIKYMIHCKF